MLYYMKGENYPKSCTVWRMPVGGGSEERVLDQVECQAQWAVGERGVYYISLPIQNGRREIRLYEFATGRTSVITEIDREVEKRLAVSPDDTTLLFTQLDQSGIDLMLVENFR